MVSSNLSNNNAPIQEIYWSGIVTCAFRTLDEIAYSGVVENLEQMQQEWNQEYEEYGKNQRYNILYLCGDLSENCNLSYEQVEKAMEIRYGTEDSNVDEDYESGEVIFVVSVDGKPFDKFKIVDDEAEELSEADMNYLAGKEKV